MPELNIKPSHKPIQAFYTELEEYAQVGAESEGPVRHNVGTSFLDSQHCV